MSDISLTMSGIHSKHDQVNTDPNPIPRVPRFLSGINNNGAKPPSTQIKKDHGGVMKILRAEQITNRTLSKLIGKMSVANQVIPRAPLFYRHLHRWTCQSP